MWYHGIIDKLRHGHRYRRADLIALFMQEHSNLSENACVWIIGTLVKEGLLQHMGRNRYGLPEREEKKPYVPLYSAEAKYVQVLIEREYPRIGFTVFESVLLNEFLNHLIARNTVYVQVERAVSAMVFEFLKFHTEHQILYRPSADLYARHWKPDMIAVQDWTSGAPLNPDAPHDITIEKMLVDIYCERDRTILYNTSEYPTIVQTAYDRFPVDTVRLLHYAQRRHRGEEIAAYIPERYR